MKRVIGSLLIGMLPVLIVLFLVGGHLDRDATALRAERQTESPGLQTTRSIRPAREGSSLIATWRAVRESDLDSLPFLEQLDASEALTLLAEMEEEGMELGEFQRLRRRVFDRLVDCDLELAMEYAGKLPVEERLKLCDYLVKQWAYTDPDACWEWFERQEGVLSETQHEALFRSIVGVRSKLAPVAREVAAAWDLLESDADQLANSIYAGRFLWPLVNQARQTGRWRETAERFAGMPRASGLWAIMHQWLDHDFAAATRWTASLPAGEEREKVVRAMSYNPNGVELEGQFDRGTLCEALLEMGDQGFWGSFGNWAKLDPIAAGRWLTRHPEQTEALENARWIYAQRLADHDSEAAMEWAASLQDPQRREATLRKTCRYWYRQEPWAAIAWAREHLGWGDEEIAKNFW